MPIDLSPAKRFIESEMVDTLTVTRTDGVQPSDFDHDGGDYRDPVTVTIYTGKGAIWPLGIQPAEKTEGGEELRVMKYTLAIPLDAPELREWDYVMVGASLRNPNLVGEMFFIESLDLSSISVAQMGQLRKRKPAYPHASDR